MYSTNRSRFLLAAVVAAAAALPQISAHAAGPASLLWTGGSNAWDTVSPRWQLAAPNDTVWNNTTDAATIAAFNTAGNVSIIAGGITAGGLNFQAGASGIVLNGPGTLTLTAGNVTVAAGANATINAPLATPAGLSLQGGGTLTDATDFSGNLTLTAGIFNTPSATNLGNGGTNTVSLANAVSAWNIAGLLELGSSGGTASANVTAGATLHTNTLTLGASGGTGSISLSGAGSTLTMDDIAYIGGNDLSAGVGNITVSGAAQVISSRTIIAGLTGSTASVTLSGANTTWAIGPSFGNALFVGSPGAQGAGGGGNGSLSILAGAHLTQDSAGGEPIIYISGDSLHPGAVTVSGTGSLLQAGESLNVGWTGPAHLDLSSGGAAVVGSATPVANTLVVDNFSGLTGAGTVNGDVINSGNFSPGTWALLYSIPGEFSSRTFAINGNYTQTTSGYFSAVIDGTSASTNTRLLVSGTASFAGTFFADFTGTVAGNTTYSIFNAGAYSGSFDAAFASGLDAPFYADLSNLTVNGTLKIIDTSIFWTNTAGGSWQGTGNWSTSATPTSMQSPVFNSPGASFTVALSADATVFSTIFRNGNVTLNLGGHTLISNVPAPLDNQTTAVVAVGDLAGTSANVTLSNGTVDVLNGNVTVGGSGNGSLVAGAGSFINANTIVLGQHPSGSGRLSVLANATLNASSDMYVGNDGSGTVTQSGGAVSANDLFLAYDPASSGNYTLTGGTLTANLEIQADDDGAVSVFTQSGGTHTVNGDLQLAGFDANSRATYTLSGTGILSVSGDLDVGESGSASFFQAGGSATIGQHLLLVPASGQTSLYSLQGGPLGTASLSVGSGGTFTQSGGTLALTDTLHITGGSVSLGGSQATYTFPTLSISGGSLSLSGLKSVVTSNYQMEGSANAWTGLIDVGVGKLLVSDSLTHGTTLADLQNQVAFARTSDQGITSSALPAHMGLAVLDNAVLHKTQFGGVTVDDSYLFVSPELLGDANADGKVDLTDLSTVLNHFGTQTPNWTDGNFDGAATIDLTDLSHVLNNFGLTNPNATSVSGVPVAGLSTAVPEPASLMMLVPAALLLAKRRR